jgi:hypothetical protein
VADFVNFRVFNVLYMPFRALTPDTSGGGGVCFPAGEYAWQDSSPTQAETEEEGKIGMMSPEFT